MELGNLHFGVKEAIQVGKPHKNLSTNTRCRGGPLRSSDETSVMEVEQREWIVRFYFLVNQ